MKRGKGKHQVPEGRGTQKGRMFIFRAWDMTVEGQVPLQRNERDPGMTKT